MATSQDDFERIMSTALTEDERGVFDSASTAFTIEPLIVSRAELVADAEALVVPGSPATTRIRQAQFLEDLPFRLHLDIDDEIMVKNITQFSLDGRCATPFFPYRSNW